MALNLFHRFGKVVNANPYPWFLAWMAVLIFGIVLFPFRGEKTDDVIDAWLPYGGQARLARDFVADLWKHQAAVAKQPGLQAQVESLGYEINDDGFFRSNRKYFIIWAADKEWDYAEGSSGKSIQTKAHYKEWYDFNMELWEDTYEVDGETLMYKDICETNYATNSWYVGEHMEKTSNPATDPIGASGTLLFEGFSEGLYDTAFAGLGQPGAEGTVGRLWDSFIKKYPDDPVNFPDEYNHNVMHSQAMIGYTAEGLAGALNSVGIPICADASETGCIRQFTEATDGDAQTFVSQYNYNKNCETYVNAVSGGQLAFIFLPLGAGGIGLGLTPNQITYYCSNLMFYSSMKGVTEYDNGCAVGDFTFCVKDALLDQYGTIFQEPFVVAVIPAYQSLPSYADFDDPSVSDEQFMEKVDTYCSTNAFLTSNNGRYIRTSKFIAQPAKIARRLQIKEGNCTLRAPDAALSQAMWDGIGWSDDIKAAEAGLGTPAWEVVSTCLNAQWAGTYLGTYAHLMELYQNATIASQTAPAAVYLEKANKWKQTLSEFGYNATLPADQATIQNLAIDCGASRADTTSAGFNTQAANLGSVLLAVGTGAATWVTWYKSSIYYDCPDYTDEAISRAMTYRDKVFDQMQSKTDAYIANATYLKAAVLSNKTEKAGYDSLFNQNLILTIAALVIFFIMVTIIQWRNKEVAVLSVVLILMCVAATFGFMPPPYTPSVAQFLPYLALGIGVDDLFVVLHHYVDEDNIPKAIHHAGATISMTSFVNALVFMALYLISNVPDFRIFTTAAAIAVGLLFLNVLIGIVPLLAIIEKCKGMDLDTNRPSDDFPDEDEDFTEKSEGSGRPRAFSELGVEGLKSYEKFKKALSPLRCIGTLIIVILIFIACTVLAVMKIAGVGFEQIDFGLKLSELVPNDVDDHAYRSVMILERFPLYSIECGANKVKDKDTYKGLAFDDYADRYIDYFHGFANLQDTSYSSVNWISFMNSSAGPQPYPYYTNMARTYPNLPNAWVYWNDWDQAVNTDIVVPESTIYVKPTTANAAGIVPGRDITKAVKRVYDYIEDYQDDLGAYCTSNILEVYERYIYVEDALLKGLGICAAIIFVVSLIILQDIGATIILTIVDMATAFQLWGFYGFATLRMNSFLTLCIMLGAAFTVQYTAHVNRRFVRSNAPTRWHKMIDALSCYAGPIFWGGATTAVAVSAAAFLPAKYFRLYFFYSFLIMVGFGLFNGLVVQSALLVLIPINSETWNKPMLGGPNADADAGRRYSGGSFKDLENTVEMMKAEE